MYEGHEIIGGTRAFRDRVAIWIVVDIKQENLVSSCFREVLGDLLYLDFLTLPGSQAQGRCIGRVSLVPHVIDDNDLRGSLIQAGFGLDEGLLNPRKEVQDVVPLCCFADKGTIEVSVFLEGRTLEPTGGVDRRAGP